MKLSPLSTSHAPKTSRVLTCWILTTTLWSKLINTDAYRWATEAQRVQEACSESHRQQVTELGSEPRQAGSELRLLTNAQCFRRQIWQWHARQNPGEDGPEAGEAIKRNCNKEPEIKQQIYKEIIYKEKVKNSECGTIYLPLEDAHSAKQN